MAATHIEHRFIPAKMQTVKEPVARAKFPIVAAAHQQERFDEENDAAVNHRITDADHRSDISWRSPFEEAIPHCKQRGAAKQKSADNARSVQSVIRFFLLHSIARRRSCLPAARRARCLLRSEEHTSELQSRPHLVCR